MQTEADSLTDIVTTTCAVLEKAALRIDTLIERVNQLSGAGGDMLKAMKGVNSLRQRPHPINNLDAAVAYRQAERDAWKAVEAAIAQAESAGIKVRS